MDITSLKEELYNQEDKIIKILESLGCGKIKYYAHNNEIRSAIDDEPDSNANSIRVKVDTLSTKSFSDRLNVQGDILSLVQTYKSCKLNEAIKHVCDVLGLEYNLNVKKKENIFGGYFKGLKNNGNTETPLQTYPHTILDQYHNVPNKRFLQDGISLSTQLKYEIMYDLESHRICIPWYDNVGNIVGVMGRLNQDEFDKNITPKYLPLIAFSKSRCVYGFYQNYNHLVGNTICIFESEKSTMRCDSEGFYQAVSIGSHNISDEQIRTIRSLNPTNIILCFDEDVRDKKYLTEQCKRFKSNVSFFQNTKVAYLLDKDNKYLEKDSKKSPIDMGVGVFKQMLKENLYWV